MHSKYRYYGGSGISICERWLNSFENFLADMGPRPSPTHSLDRYPNRYGDYQPGNVRWADRNEQFANRDIARTVIIDGEVFALADVCRKHNVNLKAVRSRLDRGWNIERALNHPIKKVPYYPRPSQRKERK